VEEEEEEGLFKANTVNEEDPERDREGEEEEEEEEEYQCAMQYPLSLRAEKGEQEQERKTRSGKYCRAKRHECLLLEYRQKSCVPGVGEGRKLGVKWAAKCHHYHAYGHRDSEIVVRRQVNLFVDGSEEHAESCGAPGAQALSLSLTSFSYHTLADVCMFVTRDLRGARGRRGSAHQRNDDSERFDEHQHGTQETDLRKGLPRR